MLCSTVTLRHSPAPASRSHTGKTWTSRTSNSYRLAPYHWTTTRAQLAAACAADGRSRRPFLSGADHDAMALAPRLSTGMLFVPSRDGTSHIPAEHSSPEQCTMGALVRTLSCLTG